LIEQGLTSPPKSCVCQNEANCKLGCFVYKGEPAQ